MSNNRMESFTDIRLQILRSTRGTSLSEEDLVVIRRGRFIGILLLRMCRSELTNRLRALDDSMAIRRDISW